MTPHICQSDKTAFKNAIYPYYVLSNCTQNNINSAKNKKTNVNSGYHSENVE